MDINISEDKVQELIEREVTNAVRARINKMIDGSLFWCFTEQHIQQVLERELSNKIKDELVHKCIDEVDKKQLFERIGKEVANEMYQTLVGDY